MENLKTSDRNEAGLVDNNGGIMSREGAMSEDKESSQPSTTPNSSRHKGVTFSRLLSFVRMNSGGMDELDASLSFHRDSSVRPRTHKKRSAPALIGAYLNLEEESESHSDDPLPSVMQVVEASSS